MSESLEEVYYKPYDHETVSYRGLLFSEDGFKEYISSRVKEKFDDTDWTMQLASEAEEALLETGFSAENLMDIFTNREMENNWRIGEYLAESILEDRYNVKFYYNNSRDAKNPMGNDTGADLVGLCDIDGEICFLFGEVKTSSDNDTPPNVLYGKSGMIKQLEVLRDSEIKRNDLVRWIWGKAVSIRGEFKTDCSNALKSYQLSNRSKVKLIGVLVRDTDVTVKDLHSRAKTLNSNVPTGMVIELMGLYSGYGMNNDNWINALNRSG
ncbi:hypothetical protein [Metabacillus idriensis]|uniref:hypothetical protein n=1 Tax=Metabacillus idriensis TaxID=324768 RepID=UPI001749A3F0|nr:hypothetical protein [Metabacillus idriensis]